MEIKGAKTKPNASNIGSKSIKKELKSMTNGVWKPSWGDLWTKSDSRARSPKEIHDFGLDFGGQNPLKTVIVGIVF